jgi:hypothetical protein
MASGTGVIGRAVPAGRRAGECRRCGKRVGDRPTSLERGLCWRCRQEVKTVRETCRRCRRSCRAPLAGWDGRCSECRRRKRMSAEQASCRRDVRGVACRTPAHDVEARVAYYQARAEAGLPLFSDGGYRPSERSL